MNLRHGSRWLGFFVLVVVIGIISFFGLPETIKTLFSLTTTFVASLLFLLASFDTALLDRVEWYRLTGIGYILMGVSFLTNALYSGVYANGEPFYVVTITILSFIFVYVGFDIARDGYLFYSDFSDRTTTE